MEYDLALDEAPTTIPGGTGVFLLHPSIGETDRVDTDFLKTDTDAFLVVSTRTTAREVEQKLEYYDVDESRAMILDTISAERGYSRRSADHVYYVAAPDDLEGIVSRVEEFLETNDGKRRVSVDSLTEMAYYADEQETFDAAVEMMELLDEHDSVGLFHLSREVHDDETIAEFREQFDGTVDLDENGVATVDF